MNAMKKMIQKNKKYTEAEVANKQERIQKLLSNIAVLWEMFEF